MTVVSISHFSNLPNFHTPCLYNRKVIMQLEFQCISEIITSNWMWACWYHSWNNSLWKLSILYVLVENWYRKQYSVSLPFYSLPVGLGKAPLAVCSVSYVPICHQGLRGKLSPQEIIHGISLCIYDNLGEGYERDIKKDCELSYRPWHFH